MPDTDSDAFYSRLSRLATTLLHTPVAFVTFLEPDRQVFRGRSVLSGPLLEVHETPITHSICHLVATTRQPVIVANTREHPVVKSNPAVEDGKVYAYAGVPIFDPKGEAIGALCAIDHEVHEWTPQDVDVLHTLAAQVMSELSMRFSMSQLETDMEEMKQTHAHRNRSHRQDEHDLRTPLNAMILSIQVVRALGELNEEQSEYLALAERNGAALSAMLDKMIDIANIENRGTEAIHCAMWNASDLITSSIGQLRVLAEQKQIVLHHDIAFPHLLYLDHDKIHRVLVNLISNAIKFTPNGGSVTVSVAAENADSFHPRVRFTVRDDGIGLASEHAQEVFADGFRVNPAAPTRHSTGLGLTFCKRVIEAHSGRIWVESTLHEGCSFIFTLPNSYATSK